ncbi:tRNA uridine(34) 5-carboxymethylaminomethyl modification radical SAM/GNAT enzyme Elp3 [Olsenella sp. YH-ols2217]|uniref:tRNA carboxymethyluridine synthase n=1 Tax=Kribbibacterium absianum TaxID=3044210 RepID=A0ABT6ZK81_9ACTN|nr:MULTISPECIES: tRNA uridine(34) 5-carboxymethylaminomethyl modification radical SAM/GNAT enzyme Elp3 [unclassified Olsenella]MDJ1122573.1 tRNA uridine(34) 5-carboxymethylaminomethyl modification radical SAM/GNAT enzyme Elp3 [Olsenella sp. YH-ols2216]MDJ1129467.1 tRNA uridine(34) 5-carboxymethylaminomethyl modification radical SAM/GNAT enzyme Elp3 [Olsenella sp. YH-ols2217]
MPAEPDILREALTRALAALVTELRTRAEGPMDDQWIVRFCREQNRGVSDVSAHVKKRALLPAYWDLKRSRPDLWRSWNVDDELEARLVSVLQAKPRRTASGVATVTVIAKPWPCSGSCRFCPSDLRMPKSYLADEPACQRAEQCLFDPYLQVSSRIRVLAQLGHPVDKVELIVLGGTWTDYPEAYRRWFAAELFRALNDGLGDAATLGRRNRRRQYEQAGFTLWQEEREWTAPSDPQLRTELQARVNAGELTYNEAFPQLYGPATPWAEVSRWQRCSSNALRAVQTMNETAPCRCVGLSFETRPDCVDPETLWSLRELGCTKVQIGVQSTDVSRLDGLSRGIAGETIDDAFALLRLFGFKIQAHQMANLPGATPATDLDDYRRLVSDPRFEPDEVKLYPCSLIEGTGLVENYREGRWRPYETEELVGLLVNELAATPRFVRVSRMVRDFSAKDIVAGNRQANLRQDVERRLRDRDLPVQEIRFREVALAPEGPSDLRLRTLRYFTTVSEERFLEWVAEDGTLHGFLRLSLPVLPAVATEPVLPAVARPSSTPARADAAMIREVHVYGRAARLDQEGQWSQHRGLGRELVEEACRQARAAGRVSVAVISAVGTRGYYRALGFEDDGLYQRRFLD